MADLVVLNKFKFMLDNLQAHVTTMSHELNRAIQSITQNQEQTPNEFETAVKELFKIRQIPYPETYDKETCEAAIKIFAEQNKWRPSTLNKTINELNIVFNKPEKLTRKQIKKIEKNKMTVQELNEDTLRAKFLKFGVRIGNDFRKEILIQLVHQKATELKWRKDTLAKNLVIINKVLKRSPLVKSASNWNWFAEMESSRIKPNDIVQKSNDSDSDASFIEYMSSALENMSKYSENNRLIVEQSDSFID